jgi:hypothetical protein
MPFVGEGGLAPIGALRSDDDGSSLGASSIDVGGDFILIDPTSVAAVVFEKRLLNVLSLAEFVRDGEIERVLSGGGLVGLSASAVDSRDMPGSLILAAAAPVSASSS